MQMPVRIAFLAAAFTLAASQTFAQGFGGWVDVNFIGAKPRQDEQAYEYRTPIFQETASFAAAYPEMGTAKGPDVAGGVTFGSGLGVGVRFVRVKAEYIPGLAISIPHPNFFNRAATDSGVLDTELKREDLDVDIFVSYDFPTPESWRVRVFGGPTYFSVKQEMIYDIHYNQVWLGQANAVEITQGLYDEVDGSGWGVNAGADVAYFFTRHIGVGGTVRFNTGTVTIDEPLSEVEEDLKAGRTTFGAGLRLRF